MSKVIEVLGAKVEGKYTFRIVLSNSILTGVPFIVILSIIVPSFFDSYLP